MKAVKHLQVICTILNVLAAAAAVGAAGNGNGNSDDPLNSTLSIVGSSLTRKERKRERTA